jgi:hypothetical protein
MALTFDGDAKLISLSAGTVSLGVRDLWSRWVDWFVSSDNGKYLPAFEQVGGQEIDATAGTSIPIYIFLSNGWRIRPQPADHTLVVSDGVLAVDGGGDPFVDPVGDHVVRINYQQPVQAITVSTSGGGGGLTPTQAAQLQSIYDNTIDIKSTVDILPSAIEIASAVWNAEAVDFTVNGTMGDELMMAIAKIAEVYQIQGLDEAAPMTVTPSARTSGAISLALSGDGINTTTVTRQ